MRNFALNTGVLTDPGLNIDYPASRGEFFSYIIRAKNYTVAHPEVIDSILPGCTSFQDINFTEISLKAPENMLEFREEGDDEFESYYAELDTGTVLVLGSSSTEGVTDIRAINNAVREIFSQEYSQYSFLQEYAYR